MRFLSRQELDAGSVGTAVHHVRLAPTPGGEGEGDLDLQDEVVDGLEAGLTLSAIDRECSSSCGRRQEDEVNSCGFCRKKSSILSQEYSGATLLCEIILLFLGRPALLIDSCLLSSMFEIKFS